MHVQELRLENIVQDWKRTQRAMTPSTKTPDVTAVWRELMSSHARVSEALEHELQRRHDLSLSEFEVLQRLAESDEGKRRMQELADEIHLSQSALSRLVGRLEAEELATRAVCDHDRRGVFACITPAGLAAQRKAEITHREVLAGMLRPGP
jgi:DNA-binding MarR family transcriptional regulator